MVMKTAGRRRVTAVFSIGVLLYCTQTGPAQALFVDMTAEVGLAEYDAESGDGHGPGAVFADLDGDGYPDIYLMRAFGNPNELYRNVAAAGGTREFMRVLDSGDADDPGDANGAIAGDYDNDGDLDLYVLNFDQPNVLLQNQLVETGQLVFTDVTTQTDPTPGVADDQHGVGIAFYEGVALDNSLTAAWADVDRDGDLDLYVGNHNGSGSNVPEGPFSVPGRRDVFYLNNGDGTFSDETMTYGVPGYVSADGDFTTSNQRFSSSNAVIFADLDNDRWPDLLVTNKVGAPPDRDMLYVNRGVSAKGTWLGFDLVTYDLLPTFGGMTGGAMGVDVGDPDLDGDLDVYITDWSNLPNGRGRNDLWVNQLAETGELAFVHSGELPALYSWGTQWQDFDNNGCQDLHVACEDPVSDFLYMNYPTGVVEEAQSAGVGQQSNARGDLTADYNRDGWPDMLVVVRSGPSYLYENRSFELTTGRNYLVVKLLGDPQSTGALRSTRDAMGARVNLVADLDGDGQIEPTEVLIREVVSGSSNAASTSSLELEFGIASATTPSIEILWPSGRRSVFALSENQFVVIDEAQLTDGDIDGDGSVGVTDLLRLLASWGACPDTPALCPADVDGNGVVRIEDLLTLLSNWS